MNLKNKQAGFWRRFGAKGVDLIIIGLFITMFSFMFIDMSELKFKSDWMFYAWSLLFALTLFSFGIIIPTLTNGSGIGNRLMKIRIISDDNMFNVMLRREFFFSLAWIFVLLLITTIINHTLIIEYLKTDRRVLTEWETFRITVITTFGGLIAFIQLGLGISLLASNDKKSFHDKTSNSNVIITNQYLKQETKRKIIDPVKIEPKQKYEWVE